MSGFDDGFDDEISRIYNYWNEWVESTIESKGYENGSSLNFRM